MSWEKPDKASLTFECDGCHETIEFTLDRHPTVDFVACLALIQADGWIALRERDWHHYCPGCAEDAREAMRIRKANEKERERIRARNSS